MSEEVEELAERGELLIRHRAARPLSVLRRLAPEGQQTVAYGARQPGCELRVRHVGLVDPELEPGSVKTPPLVQARRSSGQPSHPQGRSRVRTVVAQLQIERCFSEAAARTGREFDVETAKAVAVQPYADSKRRTARSHEVLKGPHDKRFLVETVHAVRQLHEVGEVGDAVQATQERGLAYAVLADEKSHLGQFGALFTGEAPDVLDQQMGDDGTHALFPRKNLPRADRHRRSEAR